jgi:hypothetical protein
MGKIPKIAFTKIRRANRAEAILSPLDKFSSA